MTTTSLRLLACTLVLTAAALMTPGLASASKNQLSLIQDDRELLGDSGQNPATSMREIADLGVDVVRTNIIFYKIYDRPRQRRKPSGFDASDPDSPQYDWTATDRLMSLARANGIKVLATITGPGPRWASTTPGSCSVPCAKNPSSKAFGQFAAAVAKRYEGQVTYYSIWNEPNLDGWLLPQQKRPSVRRVQTEAKLYRKLWIAGYKSIARYDRARRNRVMFGEVAAIGEPLPLLYGALCLDVTGRPFSRRMGRKHGCGRRPAALNIGGFAIHPYNSGAYGSARSKTRSKTALPLAYMPRLHRLIDVAKRFRRIKRRAPILSTEFGFQSRPPDRFAAGPKKQAQYINEADRLFYGDPRVTMVSQYELTDPPETDVFNSGLRFSEVSGREAKPAYAAYRMPIVVTKRSRRSVEVYGQMRPGGSASVQIQAATGSGSFRAVRSVRTNRRGMFKVNVSRAKATKLRWRLAFSGDDGLTTSRIAKAGKPLRYYRN
jgi:hypothetical protein